MVKQCSATTKIKLQKRVQQHQRSQNKLHQRRDVRGVGRVGQTCLLRVYVKLRIAESIPKTAELSTNNMRQNQRRRRMLVQLTCALFVLSIEAATADEEVDEAITTRSIDEEEIMIYRGLLILCGLCLAFVAAVMGLLQTFQYYWMAKYKSNGRTVTASVHDLSPTTKYQQTIVNATIDYSYDRASGPPDCYAATIRKQVKFSEEDLIMQKAKETSIADPAVSSEDCCLFVFEDGVFSFDEAVFQAPAKLSIKVVYLPDHPHSALPISQVAPSKLRLITAMPFVTTLILLSVACMHLGIRKSPVLAVAVAVGSSLVFVLLLFRCIGAAMEEEYTSNNSPLDAFTLGTFSTMASMSRDIQDSATLA